MDLELFKKYAQNEGLQIKVGYKVEGPSQERIIEQACLNNSISKAFEVMKKYDKKKLSFEINNANGLKSAQYFLRDGIDDLNFDDLEAHSFLLAGKNEKLDTNSEIKRYLKFINEHYLKELKINPEDIGKTRKWVPGAVPKPEVNIMPVLEYSADSAELLNIVPAEPHSDAKLRICLSTRPTGRAYRDEQEYFSKEIVPLFDNKTPASKINMAVYLFISQLNRRFPGEYHEGHLKFTKFALDDLLQMASSVHNLRCGMNDISSITDYNGMLSRSKTIQCSALPDSLFLNRKKAEEIVEKQKEKQELAVYFDSAVIIK